jgi:mono/diheme cytochrome c family protein
MAGSRSLFPARVAALATVLMVPLAAAAQPAAVATGQKLAGQMCQQCHVIAPSKAASWTDAPTFESIAARPGLTAASLSAIIQKPHMHMTNDQRPKNEADALAAYILSLRK